VVENLVLPVFPCKCNIYENQYGVHKIKDDDIIKAVEHLVDDSGEITGKNYAEEPHAFASCGFRLPYPPYGKRPGRPEAYEH
jgi:hypothetical protein